MKKIASMVIKLKETKDGKKEITGIYGVKVRNNEMEDIFSVPLMDEGYEDFFRMLLDFTDGCELLFYNAEYETSLINEILNECGFTEIKSNLSLLSLAQEKLPCLKDYGFYALIKEIGVPYPDGPVEEAMALARMYMELKEIKYNAVFLDIDGVINSATTKHIPGQYILYDPVLLKKLYKIVKKGKCVLYLISDWKVYWRKTGKEKQSETGNALDALMASENLKITDKVSGPLYERAGSIKEFLKIHDIDNFVILDDTDYDYTQNGLGNNYIHVNQETGLTDENIKEALVILKCN